MEIQAIKKDLYQMIDKAENQALLQSIYEMLKQEEEEDTKEAILENIEQGLREIKLIQQGKMKTTSAKAFFDEL